MSTKISHYIWHRILYRILEKVARFDETSSARLRRVQMEIRGGCTVQTAIELFYKAYREMKDTKKSTEIGIMMSQYVRMHGDVKKSLAVIDNVIKDNIIIKERDWISFKCITFFVLKLCFLRTFSRNAKNTIRPEPKSSAKEQMYHDIHKWCHSILIFFTFYLRISSPTTDGLLY